MKPTSSGKASSIETNIQEKHLRDAETDKVNITAKLGAVKDAIKIFKNTKAITEAISKPKVMTKEEREDHNQREREKDKKATSMAQRLIQQQIDIQKRKEKNDELRRQKEIEQEMLRQEQEEAEKILQEQKYKESLHEALKQKGQARKDMLTKYREAAEANKARKPLYKRIQEKYVNNTMMPELMRRKEELSRIREQFNPIRLNDIRDHALRHDEHMRELAMRRKREQSQRKLELAMSSAAHEFQTNGIANVKEFDRQQDEIAASKHAEKLRRKDKADLYSDLVREMYVPTIDPSKQLELEILKEKQRQAHKNEIIKKNLNKSADYEGTTTGLLAIEYEAPNSARTQQTKKWRPRKIKANSMRPVETEPRQVKVQDYLQERRIQRQAGQVQSAPGVKWSPRDLSAIKIKKNAAKMDAELKRRELLVSEMNPNNIETIQAKEEVSNMLIDSIRDRIAMLDEIDS